MELIPQMKTGRGVEREIRQMLAGIDFKDDDLRDQTGGSLFPASGEGDPSARLRLSFQLHYVGEGIGMDHGKGRTIENLVFRWVGEALIVSVESTSTRLFMGLFYKVERAVYSADEY